MTWVGAAVAGMLLLAVYMLLPQAVRPLVYDAAGFACFAAIVTGLRRYRPARPAPWVLIAAGVLLWGVGNVAYSTYTYATGGVPFPSWADAAYLSAYPVMAAALLVVVRRSQVRDVIAWQDACTWGVGASLLAWEWLLEPVLSAPDGGPAATGVALAYPVLDMVLLLLLARLVGSRRVSPAVYCGLALALSCYLVSDLLYGLASLAGTFEAGGAIDLGWLACYVVLAVTALHPRMGELTEPRAVPARSSSGPRLLSLACVALLAPAVTAARDFQTDRDDLGVVLVGAAVLFALTALRGAGLLRQLQALTDELRGREQELQRRATRDGLTGLPNRSVLQDRLDEQMALGEPFSVALIDLDEFKHINDARGHEVGDDLLVHVAGCLRSGLGDDLVGRLGGDEFAVLALGAPEDLAARLRACMLACASPDSEAQVRASIGVASSLAGAATGSELLRHADLAMYVAKREGGDRSSVYRPSMSTELLDELDLRRELSAAVVQGEFAAWFQPVVDLASGRLTGFEALARWERPGRAPQPPDGWMATAEQTGVVVAMDLQVLRSAARQLVRWTLELPGAGGLELAVNASGRSLHEPDITRRVLEVLEQEGLAPSRLVLEVTERVLLDEPVGARLQELRAAGVRIALDDFGTGWSSLAYLQRFPVDLLKIDRSFVTGLGAAGTAEALPAAILQLAAALELDVVAEGVETHAEALVLQRLGCRSAQGFLFAGPAPAAQLTGLVREGRLPVLLRRRRHGLLPQPELVPAGAGADLDEASG